MLFLSAGQSFDAPWSGQTFLLPTYILICGSGKALSAQEDVFPDSFALDLIMDHSEAKVFPVAVPFSLCD